MIHILKKLKISDFILILLLIMSGIFSSFYIYGNNNKDKKVIVELSGKVYGVYDLIAKIEAEDTDSLKKIVTENLRVLEKVRSTMTMICVDQ